MVENKSFFIINDDYKEWLEGIKVTIHKSQIKASVKINYELLGLYWELGKCIVDKQVNAKWGEAFLETLSNDLKKAFPGTAGFSL